MPWKDPEKRRAYKRAYDLAHPDYMRSWRLAHPRDRRESNRIYRLAHREERAAYNRAYYLAHLEEHHALTRKWREENPERARELTRQWALANPDARAAAKHRRRAREVWTNGTYTAAEWRDKLTLFAGCCIYCGESKPLTRDHKVPLARDGSNTIENIVPACRSCNARKRTKTAVEFIKCA